MQDNYGGFWLRFIAYVIDSIIVGIPVFIVTFFLSVMFTMWGIAVQEPMGGEIPVSSVKLTVGPIILGFMSYLIVILYYVLMEGSEYQATVGKKLLGLKVVNEQGKRVTYNQALVRHLSKILSGILYIGYIMIGFTEKKQGLHDLIANTYVVNSNYGADKVVLEG